MATAVKQQKFSMILLKIKFDTIFTIFYVKSGSAQGYTISISSTRSIRHLNKGRGILGRNQGKQLICQLVSLSVSHFDELQSICTCFLGLKMDLLCRGHEQWVSLSESRFDNLQFFSTGLLGYSIYLPSTKISRCLETRRDKVRRVREKLLVCQSGCLSVSKVDEEQTTYTCLRVSAKTMQSELWHKLTSLLSSKIMSTVTHSMRSSCTFKVQHYFLFQNHPT